VCNASGLEMFGSTFLRYLSSCSSGCEHISCMRALYVGCMWIPMDGDGVALRVRDQELQQRGQKGPHGSSEEDGDWLGLQGNVTNEQEEGP
jgi:hypothetical protein